MKYIIGLTGPTGSGKSYFSEIAAKKGIHCINCDTSARKAAYKGSLLLSELTDYFGSDILYDDGELNRKALAKKAFSSSKNTVALNRISLPHISKFVRSEIDMIDDGSSILLDAPTLFESGLDSICDTTVAVLADTDVRCDRIIKRDNLSEEQARQRISAGKSEEYYTQNARYTIYNNFDEDVFLDNCETIINKILGGIQNG